MNLAKKKSLLIALAIISTFSIMGCGNSNSSSSTTTQTSSQKTPSKAEIAYKAFLDLPMGATYDQAKQALGVDGKLSHENEIAGHKTQSYNFQIDNSTINLMFQEGQLTSKAMASLSFLKTNNDSVTLDKFNKVQTGMSYDQVKQIFGSDGYLASETSIMGSTSKLYHWINKNGSNAVITFNNNGVVDSKSPFGLK